jgi:hypothetical protein
MNKATALDAARNAIGQPQGRGTSWTIYGPYYCTEEGLRGPSTEMHANSYWDARAKRAEWVTYLSIQLMGLSGEDLSSRDSQSIELALADYARRHPSGGKGGGMTSGGPGQRPGRPPAKPGTKRVQICARVSPEVAEMLAEQCKRTGLPLGRVLDAAVLAYRG